jgi:hypothetical protein
VHGGGAPQVQAKARLRLAALVDPAIDRLQESLDSAQDGIALRAAMDVLDRSGLKEPERIEISRPEVNPLSLSDRELEDLILAEAQAIAARRQAVAPRS